MQLVNSMQLDHSSSSHKDESTKNTHFKCDYDAVCYRDDPAGTELE